MQAFPAAASYFTRLAATPFERFPQILSDWLWLTPGAPRHSAERTLSAAKSDLQKASNPPALEPPEAGPQEAAVSSATRRMFFMGSGLSFLRVNRRSAGALAGTGRWRRPPSRAG